MRAKENGFLPARNRYRHRWMLKKNVNPDQKGGKPRCYGRAVNEDSLIRASIRPKSNPRNRIRIRAGAALDPAWRSLPTKWKDASKT
ncbi:MAG TPA: hypothetical protein VFE47_03500, partial [Tepidisphaeraceae bacterium]|nr:hypothetical protein [Tepidisphaeraceae bacterium]